jgi:3-methyladenine DNA glycosylase AlkD
MTLQEALDQLQQRGDPKVRDLNIRSGATENQFGVKLGDIRTIAKAIKSDHELGLQLWHCGNADGRLLATLVLRPKLLSDRELEAMVASVEFAQLAEWLISYVVKQHPDKEALRVRWMTSANPMLARAGWSLTTERVTKNPEGLDLGGLLDRIERELASAPEVTQWAMNFCLGEIGCGFAEHRQRAIGIGEEVGLYRDWPRSKGCIPPYVPVWVNEIVRRQAQA